MGGWVRERINLRRRAFPVADPPSPDRAGKGEVQILVFGGAYFVAENPTARVLQCDMALIVLMPDGS